MPTLKKEKLEIKDKLNFICDKQYKKVMEKDERLYWSGESLKINKKKRIQKRFFIITNKRVINLGRRGNFLKKLFQKNIKRALPIAEIKAVTYSMLSNNFIIHLPKEYDYYFCSPDKDEIIEYILHIQQQELQCEKMKFFMLEDIELFPFMKTDKDKHNKWPKSDAEEMSLSDFQVYVGKKEAKIEEDVKNTEVLLTQGEEKISQKSFNIITVLGKGYFGKVFLVSKKGTEDLYALKVINKLDIIKRNFFQGLQNEKKILDSIKNHFVVNLDYCFASPSYIFFAMKFMQGGELYHHLRKAKRFPEKVAKFYACQVFLGMEYLHQQNIMYRDMKPENILLDGKGNAVLADFGISKVLNDKELTKSFVGTPEYVSPEIILEKGHDKSVDLWCFGILLYEMVYGLPPFYSKNQSEMLDWIVKLEPTFPDMVNISDELRDLIKQLLQKDPSKRLGYASTSSIRNHAWFKDIKWEKIENFEIEPPIKPEIKDEYDTDNFNQQLAKKKPKLDELKEIDKNIINNYSEKFEGFD